MIKGLFQAGVQELKRWGTKTAVELGKKTISGLVANVEQLLFDEGSKTLSKFKAFSNDAKTLVGQLHGAKRASFTNFDSYFKQLQGKWLSPQAGEYTMKLYEMMNQVKKSGDPVEALRNIIETEVANRMNTGFVGKKSDVILPDSFFGKEMKAAEVSEGGDQTAGRGSSGDFEHWPFAGSPSARLIGG